MRTIEAGRPTKELTLSDVSRLAGALHLPVTALLITDAQPGAAPAPEGPRTKSEHEEHQQVVGRGLGALLRALPGPAPLTAVAATMGTTLDELGEVLKMVNAALNPAGLEVRQVGGLVELSASHAATATEAVRALSRVHLARRSLNLSQALMLHRVTRGRMSRKLATSPSTGNPDQVTRGSLLNAGLVEVNPSGGLNLSEDVRFSLLLDNGARTASALRAATEGP